ncbi:uncharacterized protein PG998_007130 [Apiospora kogelbergensis]|uniref:uncharacterized protein n=1 Tax=Apiospora kogelbergensis TaxID=1337665 RepID=UPI00312FFF38
MSVSNDHLGGAQQQDAFAETAGQYDPPLAVPLALVELGPEGPAPGLAKRIPVPVELPHYLVNDAGRVAPSRRAAFSLPARFAPPQSIVHAQVFQLQPHKGDAAVDGVGLHPRVQLAHCAVRQSQALEVGRSRGPSLLAFRGCADRCRSFAAAGE